MPALNRNARLALLAIAISLLGLLCLALAGDKQSGQQRELKLVTIFTRHADRGPASDGFLPGDKHADHQAFFWPNGVNNLTEIGKRRSFNLGLAIRRHYDHYLGYDTSKVLAFSSSYPRCVQTQQLILSGIYDIGQSVVDGRAQIDAYRRGALHLADGSGRADAWKNISVDIRSVPSLVYFVATNCAYFKQNPTPLDENLLVDPAIKALPGLDSLVTIIRNRYGIPFNTTVDNLFFAIVSELGIHRTRETYSFTDHFNDWIDTPVKPGSPIKLYDILEATSLIYERHFYDNSLKNQIQLSPLFNSFITSHQVALGRTVKSDQTRMAESYQNKRMIFYNSHENVIQQILFGLGLVNTEGTYEQRFLSHVNDTDLAMFLNDLRVLNYGASFRLELWQASSSSSHLKLPYLRMAIYNEADPKRLPIEYKDVKLGSACRSKFANKFPYAQPPVTDYLFNLFELDKELDCPFDLFVNITSEYTTLTDEEVRHYCGNDGNTDPFA